MTNSKSLAGCFLC